MAKIALLVALAFAVIVAFSEVSAYKTTITTTTTIDDNIVDYSGYVSLDNPSRSKKQCGREIQGQQLNHCRMYLTQGTSFHQQPDQQYLQLCCNQIRQVEEQCQCKAIQELAQQALQQQPQGRKQGGQMQQVLKKVHMLPNQCKLEIQKCQIPISAV